VVRIQLFHRLVQTLGIFLDKQRLIGIIRHCHAGIGDGGPVLLAHLAVSLVDGDAGQPSPGLLPVMQLVQFVHCGQEGVLHNILSQLPVADDKESRSQNLRREQFK
jgi:hypothetical protein